MFTSFESFGSFFNSVNVHPRVLLTVKEFVQFRAAYLRESGVEVNLDYLISANKVVAFYDENGEWYGGYVINTGNIRYADLIDPAKIPSLEKETGVYLSDCVEITCIWKRQDATGFAPESFLKVYFYAIKNSLESGKRYVLGGSVSESILKSFMRALDKVLYEGEFDVNGVAKKGVIVYNDAEGVASSFVKYMERILALRSRS